MKGTLPFLGGCQWECMYAGRGGIPLVGFWHLCYDMDEDYRLGGWSLSAKGVMLCMLHTRI